MKLFNLILGLCFIFCAAAFADDRAEIGEVKYLVGSAKEGENELKVGSKVYDDDLITTEASSVVRLLMKDGIAIQIAPNSKFRMSKSEKGLLRVSLVEGGILSRLKKLVEPQSSARYEVVTKHASMGVRGTTFFVRALKGENTFLCVCEGTVDVARGGSSLEITATHHDMPKSISKLGMDSAQNMGTDHNDKEIAELDKLLH